jgi:hypothetical protein
VLHVEIVDHGTVAVTGAGPLIVTALTRTGITAPVEREKVRWFNTTIRISWFSFLGSWGTGGQKVCRACAFSYAWAIWLKMCYSN